MALLFYIPKGAFKKWVSLHNWVQPGGVSELSNWYDCFATGHGCPDGHPFNSEGTFLAFTYTSPSKATDKYSLYSLTRVSRYFLPTSKDHKIMTFSTLIKGSFVLSHRQ